MPCTRALPGSARASGSARSIRCGRCATVHNRWPGPSGEAVADWVEADVRTLLAKSASLDTTPPVPAQSLSPGERTRAALALLQAHEVNLLVLDEPTNHLDLPAIEQLEQALDSFEGTVLLVTHDRRMLQTVRVTGQWHMAAGRLTES